MAISTCTLFLVVSGRCTSPNRKPKVVVRVPAGVGCVTAAALKLKRPLSTHRGHWCYLYPPRDIARSRLGADVNQTAELAFIIAGALLVLILAMRARRLGVAQRNAVAAGVFGLILCGRYAALIDSVANWIFVFGCAGVFAVLALNNLGFGKPEGS